MRRLLVLVWISVWMGAASAQTVALRSKTIVVRGSSTQYLEPEKAELMLTYRTSYNVKDADRARQQQTQLLAVLQSFGIAPEKLTVYNLQAYGSGLSKTANSTVSQIKHYRLVVDKPAALDELIPKLVQSGADNVRVSNLESARLEAFRLEVMSKALGEARTKAQHIVRQVASTLGQMQSVVEVVPASGPAPDRLRAYTYKENVGEDLQERSAEADNGPVSLRKIRVNVAVDVVYELL